MNKFQVIQPSLLLTPYIKQYWFLALNNVEYNSQRLVPFGCTALSFNRGKRAFSIYEDDYLPQSYIHGITSDYVDIAFSGSIDLICIIFQPAGTKAFFNIPLNELSRSYVSLDLLQDKDLCELEQQLNETVDNLTTIGLIEQFLFHRIYKLEQYKEKRISTVVDAIHQGETSIDRLAEIACLSYKQFKRIFAANIGINPKEYLQIARFQKLYHLLQLNSYKTLEQLADECGYYDKSHLIKELKGFTGLTPSELIEALDPVYSKYHSLFRSAFIDLLSE